MQTTWQNALYEGYAGAFAGGISGIAATAVGLTRVLKKSVDKLAKSGDVSPQKRKMMVATSEDMAKNPIDIVPEGDANSVHTEGDANIQITPEGTSTPRGIRVT